MKKNEVYKYIGSNPNIMHGRPCVKGTRIHVSLIVSMLADGMSKEEILKDYPSLTEQTINAALKYAAIMCDFRQVPI